MTSRKVSDSACVQRREGLNWAFFQAVFPSVLTVLANRHDHPESFYHQHLLLALDGAQWSLRNTPALEKLPQARRPGNQRGRGGAFPKWQTAVLLEIGTHQPLGAACAQPRLGPDGKAAGAEGEMTVARRTLGGVPTDMPTLLLADRLFGCGRFVVEVQDNCGPLCSVLLRVRNKHKARLIRRLRDGSTLVAVRVCHPDSNRTDRILTLREVRGQVRRKGCKPVEVRLWTTLLDEEAYPALELLSLYAQRWEQELFYRELKSHVSRESLLRAGSAAGAEAEFGALIIAASLLARARLAAAMEVGLPAVRLSMAKISRGLQMLLPVLVVAGDILDEGQREAIIVRVMAHMAREAVIPPRRSRGCQRGLRKPTCDWPRIRSRCDQPGERAYEVIRT